ncbi:MAG: cytochrome c [Gemmataceae bacterium]|nr:cytochrome c [Gemmataceae bacterium]
MSRQAASVAGIMLFTLTLFAVAAALHGADGAAERARIEQGRLAVRGRPALNPPIWPMAAYENVWKRWGLKEKPANYAAAFRDRYGLHAAPYDNDGLPMGLHVAQGPFAKGPMNDCLLCHAGRVAGQTIIGLGNSALELQGLYEELSAATTYTINFPFRFSAVRGTVDPVNPAVFLMTFRDPDLNVQAPVELDYVSDLASDPPAWWLLKKKKTRNWTGGVAAGSIRIDMVNLLSPLNSAEHVKKQESVFAAIHAFILNVDSPKYPFAIDERLAVNGRQVFEQNCARCHGAYGAKPSYPDKVVPLETLGTDPKLATSIGGKNLKYINASWLAREPGPDGKPIQVVERDGYQAPPLDGVWATAPYFHNGSAPTVYHVLNSKARPKVFTRSYRTEIEDYDQARLGVKVTVLDKAPGGETPAIERRKVYDTTRSGQSNAGHNFGDALTEEERAAVIEYLKTL